ncbi:twin transmembrane helix small protein [uncultured Piscinibacter sp.]|uniref:twin transmembrane helix small protein n=1 Tax=uncultured Piscinibacter sp. TaxID=1131835 RepID=UPI00262D2117|nr:twin transmembrane helix small protein [uncultured Piscinibacter sp.]
MKILMALAFVGILGALASAGVFMMRDGRDGKPKSGNMMRALATRVAISVLLFAFIMLAWWMGWIEPKGLPVSR